MSERRRLAHINHKFAALGVVGAVMVLLPMAQLLRYQSAELQTLELQRASLDPMADAVALQRSLQAHGDAARPVLQGRLQMEPERQRRQADVDRRLDDLGRALAAGLWGRALDEAHALAGDWAQLARQVASRSIGVSQSDHAHRLRVEQALQVMDLLSLALGPELPGVPGASARAAAVLPRLAQQFAIATPAGDATALRTTVARQEQVLRSLRGMLALRADDALAVAAAHAEQQVRHLQSALAQPETDWTGARDLAVQAQLDLLVLARNHAAQSLDDRQQAVQQARAGLAVALTALGALALMLLQNLVRATTHGRRAPAAASAADARPRAESQPEAGRLIQRLRRGGGPDNATQPSDPQASLPPER